MDEIKRLRAELAKRQAAANAKVARLKRSKGVQVANTEYDVRRDPAKVKRYNTQQARAYLNELNSFIDRKTQFVAGAGGTPLPIQKWRAFKRAERNYAAKAAEDMQNFGNLEIPHTGLSIKAYDELMRPSVKAAGERNMRLYDNVDTKSTHIEDVKALDKWTQTRLKQATPEYRAERIKSQRISMDKMLARIGDEETRQRAANWSDDQFYVFWNYGNNAEDVGLWYAIEKAAGEEGKEKEEAQERQVDSIVREFEDTFKWVESLPTELPASTRKSRQTRKR